MENRSQRLEQIRQESVRAWQEARLNEAKEIGVSKNAQGLGINGLGAGGSSAPDTEEGPVEFVYVLYTNDIGNYAYTQFSTTDNKWSDPIDFGVSEGIYGQSSYSTNGYGIGFEFSSGGGTLLCYVDSKGKLAWSSGIVNFSDYDVDTENTIGLVSYFMDIDGVFTIKTFYKDIENTFTFSNYLGNTSFSLDAQGYDNKVLYRFGNYNDNNQALYALDVVTGSKTILYEPSISDGYEYYNATSVDPIYENVYNSLSRLAVIGVNNNDGFVTEIKVIDFNGNLLHDVGSEFAAEGFDISELNLYSSGGTWMFGKYEQTGSVDDVFMYINYLVDGFMKIIYFGFKDGAIWYRTSLLDSTFVFRPIGGNSLLTIEPDGSYTQRGGMYTADVNPFSLGVISPTGVTQGLALSVFASDFVMDGDNLLNYTIGEGGLFLLTWNTVTGDTNFEPVAVGQVYGSAGDDYYTNVVFTVNNIIEYFINAYSSDSGLWTLVYRNSKAVTPVDLFTGMSQNTGLYYTYTSKLPTLVQVFGTYGLYRVNAITNDTTLITDSSSYNYVASGNSNTWRYNQSKWIIGNNSSGIAYFVDSTEILTVYLPQFGVNFNQGWVTPDKIIIRGSDGLLYFYTPDGLFQTLVFTNGGYPSVYYNTAFWGVGNEVNVYTTDNTLYTNVLGTGVNNVWVNDEWF